MTRKSQNNNVVNKLNNVANNINNNVRNVVQNELLINTIRVLIIIYIAFGIPLMKDKHLNVANDNIVRLVIVALIVYLSFMDIVTAILLAIAFIVTIHHSSKSHSNNEKINTVNDVKALVDKVNNIVNNKEGYENNEKTNEAENNTQPKNSNLETIDDSTNVLAQNAEDVSGYDSDEDNANAGANFDGNASAQNEANTEAVNNGNAFNAGPNPSGNNNVNTNNANVNANNKDNANSNNTANPDKKVLDINSMPKAFDNNKELSVFDEVNNAEANNNFNNVNNVDNAEDIITQNNKNQPASETITESILRAQGAQMDVNAPVGLTTSANLYDISENAVPGADIMNQVKTIQEQHGAQGMDYPHGVGAKRYDGFHFDQDNHPNLQHQMLRNERIE